MTDIDMLRVAGVILASSLVYLLYRVAVLTNQVGMLQDWAGQVTYELVAQEQAHEVALMRERMNDLERELAEHHDSSDSFPAEAA